MVKLVSACTTGDTIVTSVTKTRSTTSRRGLFITGTFANTKVHTRILATVASTQSLVVVSTCRKVIWILIAFKYIKSSDIETKT